MIPHKRLRRQPENKEEEAELISTEEHGEGTRASFGGLRCRPQARTGWLVRVVSSVLDGPGWKVKKDWIQVSPVGCRHLRQEETCGWKLP